MSSKSQSKSRAKKGKGRSHRKVVDSWKLKKWYSVYAPKSFKEQFIGEIPSANPENLKGRVVETLLYNFTNDFRHSHIKLRFKVTDVINDRCQTMFVGHDFTRDYIISKIHRGSSRIDGIFNFKTADGFVYRVSTFTVTVRRAKDTQKKAIRKIIYEVLSKYAESSKHGKFIRGIVYGNFAENIAKIAKTIYPLRECQVRKTKLISFPEGATDEDYDENEVFEEQSVKLKVHGKQIKARKGRRKSYKSSQKYDRNYQSQRSNNNSNATKEVAEKEKPKSNNNTEETTPDSKEEKK
ncbi:MAG: 30S ribosomal protein S3ae [Promethearchaeota archaeon]